MEQYLCLLKLSFLRTVIQTVGLGFGWLLVFGGGVCFFTRDKLIYVF